MKRLLSLVLVAAFALPLVIGCGGDEPKKAPSTPATKAPADAGKGPDKK